MRDINTEITEIQEASRGEDVRQSIVDALNELNAGTVPAASTSDAGKILYVNSIGQWVAGNEQYVPTPTGTINIDSNGTYDVTNKASAVVSVQGGGGSILVPKTIIENGNYNPSDDNADGYSSVNVNVLKFIEPLDYLENSHYYIANISTSSANENYYGTPIETVASFLLEIGSNYVVALDDNPGNRFRRGLFDGQPFTVIPSPEPTGTDQVTVQQGLTVWNSWISSSYAIGNDPSANISFGFNATKRYLAVHLSTIGEAPNVYLVKLD